MTSCRPRLTALVFALAGLVGARSAEATKCPNIMFVLDRSGSMAGDPNGGSSSPSKWQLLQTAVKTIVTQYGGQIPFGMEMFTSGGFDDASCYATTMISVEPAHGTAAKIISTVLAAMPDSGTNTAQAIRRARQDAALKDPTRAQFIVLITDGDPNCPFDDSTSASYSVKEITAGVNQSPSIHTFVIGFDGSGGVNPTNLNNMANAGKEPITGCPGGKCYYSASSAQKLNDAISKIVNQVMGGEFGTSMCDDSCLSNGCPSGQVCTTDEFNMAPHCINDPCASAHCTGGDFCRLGMCVHPCGTACAGNQLCSDGNCIADPCSGSTCGAGQACDKTSGSCITDLCQKNKVSCAAGSVCDPKTGMCAADQCHLIQCPSGTTCVNNGNCVTLSGPSMMGGNDMGSSMTGGPGSGTRGAGASVGCSVSPASDGAGLLVASLALVALALFVRRRASV